MPDALLVTTPANIFYLTGTTCEGYVVMHGKKIILITDGRYIERAQKEAKRGVTVRLMQPSFWDLLASLITELRIKKLGIESEHLTVAQCERFMQKLPRVEIVPVPTTIESKRLVKSPEEITTIKKACHITSRVLTQVLKELRFGITEREVAEAIRRHAFHAGCDELAFPSIVAFGSNSSVPHAEPGSRRLKKGDVLQFDMGVKLHGYCSDMSRAFFTAAPTNRQKEVYTAVLSSQLAGVAAVRSGLPCEKIDAACRDSLGALAQYFTHSTGHGVGIDIHESPRVSSHVPTRLKSSMVITVEPGVYIPEQFGFRIEDTVAVTKVGCDVLTPFPKKLTVLPLK